MTEKKVRVGELVENRYRVLSVVGSGGMGTLYRVSDEARDGETIALKTLRSDAPATDTPERVVCFRREFQLLTQLHHPNLVNVFNYGVTAGGELYFTMEWVEGHDLEPSQRPLKPTATIPVIVQICHALAYLHARGIIHGDLKPSNILVTGPACDQVKLVDFGVALEGGTSTAQAQYYTPGYTAPEMRRQQPADHRADLYSLGALWYALLAGEPPTFVPGAERLIRLTLKEVLENQEHVPAEFGPVILRLLKQSPKDRYASANVVIAAVNEATGSTYALETRETASSYALRGRFVGREAEMEVLQALWKQAQAGESKLVLVSGEAGVGKTRLVEEFVVQAELGGARVARGQCVESGGIAYRPWREVLRVLVRHVEGADVAGLEMTRVGPVLAMLLSELWGRDYMAGLAPPAELAPQAAQQRLHDAIAQVLRATAALRPTVVVIEDAHWADEATLALLNFLARTAGQAGLLVCVTYRDDESGPARSLNTLSGSQIEHIPLRRLQPQTTTDLVRSMLGLDELPTSLTERVQQTTGGNAFFVQELIRSLAEDGTVLRRTVDGWQVDRAALKEARLPESIRQVAWRRMEHLSPEAHAVLRRAAIVGPMFWDGVVERIGQIPRKQVQTALGEGLEKELIFERDTSAFAGEREFLFAKPAVQEVSYESVSQQERQETHGRVAAWLMARSDAEISEHLGLIADHLERAGQMEQAVTYLHRAGEQAAAQFANAEAVAYLSRALDLTPGDRQIERYTLLLAREKVYDLQGVREAQRQDLAALEELTAALDDADCAQLDVRQAARRRAELALRRANYSEATADYPAAIAAAQTAIHLGQTIQDAGTEAAGYLRWGWALWHQAEYEAARTPLEKALGLARAAGVRKVEAYSLLNLGIVFNEQGDPAKARACYEQALSICREIGDRQGENWALNDLGIISSYRGNYSEASAYWEQALRIARETGDRRNEAIKLANLGEAFHGQGDHTEARTYYEQALHIYREVDDREGVSTVLCDLGLLSHHLGNDEAAREYSQQALRIAREIGSRRIQGYALTNLGHALVEMGRLTEAADAYHQALTMWRELGQPNMAMEPLAGLACVSLAQGDLTQAQTWAEEILSYLENDPPRGPIEPFRIYLACYRVLRANQDPRADDILNSAHHLLQERAAKISDEELRRSFLENVAAHREIVREWHIANG